MKVKIVKIIAGLTIVSVVGVGAISCANKKPETVLDVLPGSEQEMLDSLKEPIIAGGSNVDVSDTNADSETETKVEKYDALDFQTVTDYEAEYDRLIALREEYNKTMKKVVDYKVLYSTEQIAYAIYNVVKVDNDLSCLLLKIYDQRLAETENQIYLADQIESLEDVLNKMKDLQEKVNTARQDFNKGLDELSQADVEQIERVQKFTITPLNRPMKQLERQVKQLRKDLEEALASQTSN